MCLRHVDDLIIRKEGHAEINHILVQSAFNNVKSNLQFTTEKEKKNKINFLDVGISEQKVRQ